MKYDVTYEFTPDFTVLSQFHISLHISKASSLLYIPINTALT